MDQNQTVDNDLQKAIDDITNTTNTDPVFPILSPRHLQYQKVTPVNWASQLGLFRNQK